MNSIMYATFRGFGWCLVGLALLLTGCGGQRVLMPTPNVHLEAERDFFGALDPRLKSTEVPLFYVTDRAPERDQEDNLRYGYNRSGSLAFGKVVVDLGADITWEELLEASRTQRRIKPLALEIRGVEEIVRSTKTPPPYKEVDGRIVEKPDLVARRTEAIEAFRRVLVRQLELTPRKEVFIFVHGYNNSSFGLLPAFAASFSTVDSPDRQIRMDARSRLRSMPPWTCASI